MTRNAVLVLCRGVALAIVLSVWTGATTAAAQPDGSGDGGRRKLAAAAPPPRAADTVGPSKSILKSVAQSSGKSTAQGQAAAPVGPPGKILDTWDRPIPVGYGYGRERYQQGWSGGTGDLMRMPLGRAAALHGEVRLFQSAPLEHSDPDDPGRHVGKGQPLEGTSWLNRPLYAGWFVGALFGDDLINGQVMQDGGFFGGYRLGWDFDHYWGSEMRLALTYLDLTNAEGLPLSDSSRDIFWDVHLLHYPWGDSRWRPYCSIGLGMASFKFEDEAGRPLSESLFHLPLGFGIKFYARSWLVFRCELHDNIAFGGKRVDEMQSFSFTSGVEVRMGGRPKSYYPWSPGVRSW